MNRFKFILIAILLLASFLRIWRLDEVPVSLFGDELDVGYQAYSILRTGRDYSGNPWPLHFHSLAEWRTPLYLYSSVPTVAMFGISPWGVRLPAALYGVLGVFVFYLLVKELLGYGRKQSFERNHVEAISLIGALLIAISPWHIQYSRAGFEVTQMLALFLLGILFFFKGLKNGKWLPLSAVFLTLTPWSYSTAKLFTPMVIVVMILIWRKDLFAIGKKWLLWSFAALIVVGFPIVYSTAFGGGTARFSYLSIFTDPTVVPQIGWDRLRDDRVKDPSVQFGVQPNFIDKIFHNKFLYWSNMLIKNYLEVFSTQFLFIKGDLNLRHSPSEMGQFYRIEIVFLLIGIAFFLISPISKKIKTLLVFWLLSAPIPAILTRDGGMHATRLFFLLPMFILLIALGIYYVFEKTPKYYKKIVFWAVAFVYILTFTLYQHSFWNHYPWESERWWHAGFKESFQKIKEVERSYDRIIISTYGEPPWIFFAGWYEYPPEIWQENFPFPKISLPGYGEISHLGKFYFSSPPLKNGIYSLSEFVDAETLYLASAKEFNIDFIKEPGSLPKNLKMVLAVPFPSGEPAYYLLTLNNANNE